MKTTLYNHKIAGSDKPLIPNIIFKSLIFLIEHNQVDDYEYIISNYSMIDFQQRLIKDLINIKNLKK